MGGDVLVSDDLKARAPGTAPNRFARWPRPLARAALAAFAFLLVASALVQVFGAAEPSSSQGQVDPAARELAVAAPGAQDEDIALYRAAIRRIAAGENYYDFIVAEQRARDYPVRPGLVVRLPTLAYLSAWLGTPGQLAAALALMLGTIAAWWIRLGEDFGRDPGSARLRRLATALVAVGISLLLNRHYWPLHELWSGGLLALSFGLHRIGRNGQGGRWIGAWVAAGLALAIRELALPFVLLMGAFALYHGNRREALAWGALVAVFLAALGLHFHFVARTVVPGDLPSPSWLALRGLAGWLGNVAQTSNLHWFPHWLAGPVVVLMTFGWLGWNSRAGLFGFLLGAGYGVLFMIAGRGNNFYWGAMIAPVIFAGIVFAPRALAGLVAAAGLRALQEPSEGSASALLTTSKPR